MNCVYTMYLTVFLFKAYCNFKVALGAIPPLFQEATCSDLAFSTVLSFFEIRIFKDIELIRLIKEQLLPHILSNLQYVFQNRRSCG